MKTLTIDKAGRVVLPKPVRDEMQLRAGDSLKMERSEDKIVLRPVREGLGLRKKQGIWVVDIGEPMSVEAVNKTVRDIRDDREMGFLGRSQPAKNGKKRT